MLVLGQERSLEKKYILDRAERELERSKDEGPTTTQQIVVACCHYLGQQAMPVMEFQSRCPVLLCGTQMF